MSKNEINFTPIQFNKHNDLNNNYFNNNRLNNSNESFFKNSSYFSQNMFTHRKPNNYNSNSNKCVNFFANSNRKNLNNVDTIQEYSYGNILNEKNKLNAFNQFNQFQLNNNNFSENVYIQFSGFDNNQKKSLYYFLQNYQFEPRNIKQINHDKIILYFPNSYSRNNFIEKYQKIQDNFIGVIVKFLNEDEYNKIVNNNSNMINQNLNFSRNNFMDINGFNYTDETSEYPKKKTNLQKFLEVLFNI